MVTPGSPKARRHVQACYLPTSDHKFSAFMGTMGTIMGVSTFLRLQNKNVQIVGVQLAEEASILGMSSGGAAAVVRGLATELSSGLIVTIVCDRGDRYLFSNLFAPTEREQGA